MKLGELIETRRKDLRLTQQDLADACGLSKSYVWEVENGKTVNIGLLPAIRIAMCLNLTLGALAAAALEPDALAASASAKEKTP